MGFFDKLLGKNKKNNVSDTSSAVLILLLLEYRVAQYFDRRSKRANPHRTNRCGHSGEALFRAG
jgi:hypothetical protein